MLLKLRTIVFTYYFVFLALPANATQTHTAPEGLYVHQAGHILFFFAMLFFSLKVHRNPLLTGKGWKRINIACILFLFWNVDTFTLHWLQEYMPDQIFVGGTGAWSQALAEMPARLGIPFYVLKFDHLICVPAIFFFFLGLKNLTEEKQ